MLKLNNQSSKIQTCFYICGLTGGPYLPIPAIISQIQSKIPNTKQILIGVENSYESRIANDLNYDIKFLPKAKLDLLSFRDIHILETIEAIFKSFWSGYLLIFSFFRCLYLLLQYQPILIYSTGSFLAVPMIYAAKVTNILRLTNAKLVIHQQDASLGLANKLTTNLADLTSCVFEFTKKNYLQFKDSFQIPNPIVVKKYDKNNSWKDKTLEKFIKGQSQNKPILLIFGGGSGAEAINLWVAQNIPLLLNKFRVIHLTGLLQNKLKSSQGKELNTDYYRRQVIIQDMPVLLANVDLVICRAGMGSISELTFLNKPTFLVPIPNSHQEQNAILTSQNNSNFKVLDQNNQNNWVEQIISGVLKNQDITKFDQDSLNIYYDELVKLLTNN